MSLFIKQKELLQSIIKENDLSILYVIVGISGGVDSAVTYKMLKKLEKEIPQLVTLPVIIPIYNSIGSTEQKQATALAELLCDGDNQLIKPDPSYVDIASKALSAALGNQNNSYLTGQSDYWIRPTLLYNIACKYTTDHEKRNTLGIVCGTINKSEYETGFFGKKTDTCDIQLINTYTKTEIYELANILEVPSFITDNNPKGNVHDSKSDEEMLNISYKDIDLLINKKTSEVSIYAYTRFKQLKDSSNHKKVIFRDING